MRRIEGIAEQIRNSPVLSWKLDLTRPEQERLFPALLEELDGPADMDVDRAWLEEIQRRSAEFDAGLMEVIPSEEVFARVRARIER